MASIYSRNGILWIQYRVMGKRFQKSLQLADDREGRSQAAVIKAAIESERTKKTLGIFLTIAQAPLLLSKLWQAFMDDEGRNKKPSTLEFYERTQKKSLEYLGDMNVKAIDRKTMFDLRDALRRAEGDQNAAICLRHLKAMFGWAADNGHIPMNPLKRVDFSADSKPVVIFRPDEIERIFAVCHEKLLHQCQFLLLTGFRLQESCNLRWDMIDYDKNIIKHHNQKGEYWAQYELDSKITEFLKSLPRTYGPYVFGYRNRVKINREFLLALRKTGLVPKKGVLEGKPVYSIHTLMKNYL